MGQEEIRWELMGQDWMGQDGVGIGKDCLSVLVVVTSSLGIREVTIAPAAADNSPDIC